MNARGLDVSGLYQDPAKMRYADWRDLGFCFGWYSVAIGLTPMVWAAKHQAGMQAAGYLTGNYAVISERGSPVEQARLHVQLRHPDDRLPFMLDAERKLVTESMLRAYCDEYDRLTRVPLWMYTGFPWWTEHVPPAARARYAKYGLAIAAYPFDRSDYDADGHWQGQLMDPASVALRSTPPLLKRPAIPPPWTQEESWQHTGHGSLPGYDRFLDLQVGQWTEAELRARFASDAEPAPPEPPATGHVARLGAEIASLAENIALEVS